jgi:hypothetical protein
MNAALENLEAAKLASLIGSQLKAVDQSAVDRSNIPANRINIQEFASAVTNPYNLPRNKFNNVPHGFAAPPSEDIIRSMVPDAPNAYVPSMPDPQPIPQPAPQLPPEPKIPVVIPQQLDIKQQNNISNVNVSNTDVESIKKSLKSISISLQSLVDLFKAEINKKQ